MVFFIFIQILTQHSVNSGVPDQTPQNGVSDLGLHCLPMSHNKDVRHSDTYLFIVYSCQCCNVVLFFCCCCLLFFFLGGGGGGVQMI